MIPYHMATRCGMPSGPIDVTVAVRLRSRKPATSSGVMTIFARSFLAIRTPLLAAFAQACDCAPAARPGVKRRLAGLTCPLGQDAEQPEPLERDHARRDLAGAGHPVPPDRPAVPVVVLMIEL